MDVGICGFCRCCSGVSGGGKLLIISNINKVLIFIVAMADTFGNRTGASIHGIFWGRGSCVDVP